MLLVLQVWYRSPPFDSSIHRERERERERGNEIRFYIRMESYKGIFIEVKHMEVTFTIIATWYDIPNRFSAAIFFFF